MVAGKPRGARPTASPSLSAAIVSGIIYPSPIAPDRYVSVVAGTSADGLYFWNPPLWHTSAGFPTLQWDWVISDGRRVALSATSLGAQRGWVAAGVFDQHWRRDDRWVYPGDSELRRNSPLRHPPAPGFTVPGQVLDSYAGDYALAPGVVIHIERQGDQLLGVSPTGQRTALDPETNTEFVVHDTTDVLYFTSDEHGQVKGAVLNNGGQEVSAARIRKQP